MAHFPIATSQWRRAAVRAILGTGTLTPNQPGDSLRLIKSFRQQQFFAAGWAAFDDTALTLNLPNPYRRQERLDSLAGRR